MRAGEADGIDVAAARVTRQRGNTAPRILQHGNTAPRLPCRAALDLHTFDGTQRVEYLPLVSDVQLAVWRGVRRILARFAMAGLPNPNKWTNTMARLLYLPFTGACPFFY